jgi:cytochrome c oxidase assembly factor CtaG
MRKKHPPCANGSLPGPAYDSDLMRAAVRGVAAAAGTLAFILMTAWLTPASVLAHGDSPPEPTLATLWTAWSFDVDVWLPVLLLGAMYWSMVRRIDRLHPGNPVPRFRLWAWLGGLAVIVLALASPIERYDTTLFSVHMIQHLLLVMVAAPLLVLAAPVTLLLRVATPEARRRWLLPVLHSKPLRVVANPVVAWVLFAGVMWVSHFSPLFNAALEDPLAHRFEHALFLGSALLFWWPVVGADPTPYRLSHPARLLYLGLGMPWSSLLGLAIFSSSTVLYEHYASVERDWGMTPLEDQAWAGGIMWVGGDLGFIVALVIAVAVWLRAEEREGRRVDERLARERARQGASASPGAASDTLTG